MRVSQGVGPTDARRSWALALWQFDSSRSSTSSSSIASTTTMSISTCLAFCQSKRFALGEVEVSMDRD